MREEVIRRLMIRLGIHGGYQTRDWVSYHCPFAPHTHMSGRDRNASFGIKVNERGSSHYYCFTCKKAGPFSALPVDLAGYEETPFDPKAEMLQIIKAETEQGFGLFEMAPPVDELGDPLDPEMYLSMYEPVMQNAEAREYMQSRGVTEEAAERLNILYDPDDRRVVFPVHDLGGALYGFTGRTILPESEWPNKSYKKSKDYLGLPKKHLLLNIHNYRQGQRIALVEGPFDVAAVQSMIEDDWNVCPVGLLGSSLLAPKRALLTEVGAPVYLMFDNDVAGDAGLYGTEKQEGAYQLLVNELPIFIPLYPDGVSDPGELNKEQLRDMLFTTPMERV